MSTFSSPCMILISFSCLKNIFLISIANFWKYISRNIYDCYDCLFVMYPLSQKKHSYIFFVSSPISIKMYGWVIVFIRPFEKRDVLCHGNVRPSVRPRFPDFSSTCFEISIWNLVYTFSRWHDMSSSSCITIGSLWPSLQPKVGQTHFFSIMAS